MLITTKQAAKLLNVSVNTVRYHVRAGSITPISGGGSRMEYVFDKEQIEEFAKSQGKSSGGVTVTWITENMVDEFGDTPKRSRVLYYIKHRDIEMIGTGKDGAFIMDRGQALSVFEYIGWSIRPQQDRQTSEQHQISQTPE